MPREVIRLSCLQSNDVSLMKILEEMMFSVVCHAAEVAQPDYGWHAISKPLANPSHMRLGENEAADLVLPETNTISNIHAWVQ